MDEWNEMYENVVYVDGMQKFKKFYDSREMVKRWVPRILKLSPKIMQIDFLDFYARVSSL